MQRSGWLAHKVAEGGAMARTMACPAAAIRDVTNVTPGFSRGRLGGVRAVRCGAVCAASCVCPFLFHINNEGCAPDFIL